MENYILKKNRFEKNELKKLNSIVGIWKITNVINRFNQMIPGAF